MRNLLIGLCVLALASCGSSNSRKSGVTRTAGLGLIERACITSDRRAANSQICSCVQQTADLTLSRSDQQLAVTFYKDPHQAQVIRQSDRASHEAFWQRYKAYAATARDYCSPSS